MSRVQMCKHETGSTGGSESFATRIASSLKQMFAALFFARMLPLDTSMLPLLPLHACISAFAHLLRAHCDRGIACWTHIDLL